MNIQFWALADVFEWSGDGDPITDPAVLAQEHIDGARKVGNNESASRYEEIIKLIEN